MKKLILSLIILISVAQAQPGTRNFIRNSTNPQIKIVTPDGRSQWIDYIPTIYEVSDHKYIDSLMKIVQVNLDYLIGRSKTPQLIFKIDSVGNLILTTPNGNTYKLIKQ